MRFVILFALLLFLMNVTIGTNAYAQDVYAWQGHSANALISDWGPPDVKVINANGNTVLIYNVTTYLTYNRQFSPSVGINVGTSGRPIMVVQPNTNPYYNTEDISLKCTVKFIVDRRGIVVSTHLQGEGCSADRIHP